MKRFFIILLAILLVLNLVSSCTDTVSTDEAEEDETNTESEKSTGIEKDAGLSGEINRKIATLEYSEKVLEENEAYIGTDFLMQMIEACVSGDIEAGREAESFRNKKIKALGLDDPVIVFDDLYELAKIITAESGSGWLSMDWKMAVGEVVLNRVSSPEFPDTVYEVIHQEGQYQSANSDYYKNLVPNQDCAEAAARLLSGEGVINEPSVVFQSNSKQGGGVFMELYDSYYGYTYLCYSSYPEYYA